MKFKNFDIADVFGHDDTEQAEKYINTKGYFANSLEGLDDLGFLGTLNFVCKTSPVAYYCKGDTNFKYFLPLEKVKSKEYFCDFKTEPVKKDQQYRPLRNKRELIEFICENTNSSQVIGTVICIKKKGESQVTVTTITAITDYFDPLSDKPIYEITLGTGKTYSFECLFGLFEIAFNYNQLWRPFGVLENE